VSGALIAAAPPAGAPLRAAHRRAIRAWALALGFGAAAFALARTAAIAVPPPRPLAELSYYPSGAHLEPATLGHAQAAADLAWLRAVQYYGGHRYTDNRFVRMEHVFDILTSLAPGFIPAYVFGSFALAQEGGDFPAAERLMLKGLRANPRSGELAFQAGFLYFVRPGERDFRSAARYFSQSARQADAPREASRFAAFAEQQSGDLGVAYELWAQVAATTHNRYLRDMAEEQMKRIQAALASGQVQALKRHLPTPIVQLK
jgi:hypothetical protein